MTDLAPKTWGTEHIADQTGRTFIITGANSGLGAVATRVLASRGATVVMACRTPAKARPIADELGAAVSVEELDLADLSSVRAFADRMGTVDVLINNAGVMAIPLRRTVDGFEMQLATNHLGHFALTGLLLPKITDRVVTVSSDLHQRGKIDLEDLNYERRPYNSWAAYSQSKLANLLFARELQRRLTAAGSPLKSVASHPGYAATGLQSNVTGLQGRLIRIGNRVVAMSAAQGTVPELFAATSPDAVGGAYYGPSYVPGRRGNPGVSRSSRTSRDLELAAKLWTASEELTGVTF